MTTAQRYVSKELTHFIGKELPDDEKRYELLIEILTSGWLTHPPHKPEISTISVMVNPKACISKNKMYNPSCVCFCDIPVIDLDIHMDKYSRFGISFLKRLLASKGANPVFYIANNSSVSQTSLPRGEYFDAYMKTYHEFRNLLVSEAQIPERKDPWSKEVFDKFNQVRKFLEYTVFSFIKCYDESLAEDNEANYYMEREWRILGNLKFESDDVYRVIMPKDFAKRFRKDMPNYTGRIELID